MTYALAQRPARSPVHLFRSAEAAWLWCASRKEGRVKGQPKKGSAEDDKARDMLLGQHSVSFTADTLRLPEARVQAMAEALVKAKRIPRVRA